jgi:hypothetical protein
MFKEKGRMEREEPQPQSNILPSLRFSFYMTSNEIIVVLLRRVIEK